MPSHSKKTSPKSSSVKASVKVSEKSSKAPPTKLTKRSATSLHEDESKQEDSLEAEDIDDVQDEEEDEDEEDDVDEAGMAKLMEALGEDGLHDFARQELLALAGSDDEDVDEDDESGEEDAEENDVGGGEADSDTEGQGKTQEQTHGTEHTVPVDELSDAEVVDEDSVPRQKVEIDNKIALERIRDTIKLDPALAWTETLAVTYPETIDVDVDDDLNRELAFYKQALHGANTARSLAAKHNLPFTRPADYFAEMVKSDAHMERIRQRLLDESASIKRSEDKRKEREGKKFGKQVQLDKIREREKGKKDMEERLKGLKRKRKDALDNPQEDGGDFDVAVEDAISDRPSKRPRGSGPGGKKTLHDKRETKTLSTPKAYGFGSVTRFGFNVHIPPTRRHHNQPAERFQRLKKDEEDKKKQEEILARKRNFDSRFKTRGKRPTPDVPSSSSVTENPAKKPKVEKPLTQYEKSEVSEAFHYVFFIR
ncbi:putative rRNA-processing protein ebp2 [Grifola frondosa]|uniref:Putative rRNA-processing protein ebp2 n=1 Tax=Grifola frondosa TaxID=5627 RepID=A0A1C7LWW1_GRIFR|nr:putative rRNA-processing protein ebp2 [Grifola frondosa]